MSRVLFNKRVRRRHDRDGDGEYSYSDSYELVDGKWVEKEPTPPGEQQSDEPKGPFYVRYSKLIAAISVVIIVNLIGMLMFTQMDPMQVRDKVKVPDALEALYFSVVVTTTIGYGDIYPVDNGEKIAVMIYGIIGLGVIGWVLSLLSDYSQRKVQALMEKVQFPESSSDPYVIVLSPYNCLSFVPGCERVAHKSPHFEKNLSPVWEDMEVWEIAHSVFAKDVVVQVRDWDDNNFDDLIGEVHIDPQTQIGPEWQEYSLPLTKVEDKDANPHIQLAMKFDESSQVLSIKLLSCTDLPIMDDYTGLLATSVNNLKELVTALVILILVLLGGAGLFAGIEEWRFFDGIYFAWITASTIGYGDFSPSTKTGRILFLPYAFLAVGIGGYIIGLIQAGGVSAGATSELPHNPDGSLKVAGAEQEEAAWALRAAFRAASASGSSSGSEYSTWDEWTAEEQEEEIAAILDGDIPMPPGLVLPRIRRKRVTGAARTFKTRAREYKYVEVDENGVEIASVDPAVVASGAYTLWAEPAFDASPATLGDDLAFGWSSDSSFDEQQGEETDDKRYDVSATDGGAPAVAPAEPAPSGFIPAAIKPSTYFGNGFGYRFVRQTIITVGMVFVGSIMAPIEDWRWFEGIYTSLQTLTTVGYGDFLPTEDDAKVFVLFYTFLGLAALSGFFSLVSEASTSPPTDPELLRLEARLAKHRSWGYRFFHSNVVSLLFYIALLLLSIAIGAGVWATTDASEASYVTYIYLAVITLTTIGFGDLSPQSDEGRVWFMFFLLFGISQLSHILYLVQKIVGDIAERSLAELAAEDGDSPAGVDAIEAKSLEGDDHMIAEYARTGKMDLQLGVSNVNLDGEVGQV